MLSVACSVKTCSGGRWSVVGGRALGVPWSGADVEEVVHVVDVPLGPVFEAHGSEEVAGLVEGFVGLAVDRPYEGPRVGRIFAGVVVEGEIADLVERIGAESYAMAAGLPLPGLGDRYLFADGLRF